MSYELMRYKALLARVCLAGPCWPLLARVSDACLLVWRLQTPGARRSGSVRASFNGRVRDAKPGGSASETRASKADARQQEPARQTRASNALRNSGTPSALASEGVKAPPTYSGSAAEGGKAGFIPSVSTSEEVKMPLIPSADITEEVSGIFTPSARPTEGVGSGLEGGHASPDYS